MKIIAKLMNEKKEVEGIYRSAKDHGFEDLIIVPRLVVEETPNSISSTAITKEMLETIGKTEDDIYSEAFANVKGKITNMEEVMGLPTPFDMTIITNENYWFGAIAAITMQKEIETMFPDGYIILPSSVHEVIVIPKEMLDIDTLINMVTEINELMVDPKDRLSDNVYEF